jgi:hypothetical protein
MKAHPHPHRAVLKRALRICGCRHCVGGAGEGDEEGIALRVDLDSLVPVPRFSQESVVLGEYAGVVVADLP